MTGIEPVTPSLPRKCSTTELRFDAPVDNSTGCDYITLNTLEDTYGNQKPMTVNRLGNETLFALCLSNPFTLYHKVNVSFYSIF